MEGVQMSDYTIPTSNTVTTIDPQATKIRELQSDVNELKELVEYLQDRIKLMNSTGDELLEWLKLTQTIGCWPMHGSEQRRTSLEPSIRSARTLVQIHRRHG